jgi:predicted DNA binding CopG/RHH family protein
MDKKDKVLIDQAKAKKERNNDYFPTVEELQAIDRFLVNEAKERNLARLTLRIPEDLKERFEKKAEALGVPMSQVSRKLIEGWLGKSPKKMTV